MGSTTGNGVFNGNGNKKMTEEPKPKWGDRTAAGADGAEYLTGIGVAGYTGLKDVFMEKPRAGACYRYINLKNIVHEES